MSYLVPPNLNWQLRVKFSYWNIYLSYVEEMILTAPSFEFYASLYSICLFLHFRLTQQGDYLPILFIDQMSNRIKDLLVRIKQPYPLY